MVGMVVSMNCYCDEDNSYHDENCYILDHPERPLRNDLSCVQDLDAQEVLDDQKLGVRKSSQTCAEEDANLAILVVGIASIFEVGNAEHFYSFHLSIRQTENNWLGRD